MRNRSSISAWYVQHIIRRGVGVDDKFSRYLFGLVHYTRSFLILVFVSVINY